jgi:putative transposase
LLLEKNHPEISVVRQTQLLEISRSTAYYQPVVDPANDMLMKMIDEIYTDCPFYGSRRMKAILKRKGYPIGRDRVCRLMQEMGIVAIYPKRRTTFPEANNKKYPYLLKDLKIRRPDHVWSTDITYIRLQRGFVYLVAILDWYSRYVLSFRISLTLEEEFCIEALKESLERSIPKIFNSDQGSQFTGNSFTGLLESRKVQISMDSKGRAYDNIFTERLWRSVKYEEVYLKNYVTPIEAHESLKKYFNFYNHERPHQSLNYQTPAEIYFKKKRAQKNGFVPHLL